MSNSLTHILRSALHDSVEQNRALPAEFYTSDELRQLELDKLFKAGWICLGRTDELSAVGDYFTSYLIGEPVIVVRSTPDQIDVLANVCRHRGMPVAEGKGNTKRFRCSYHAWTYELDGRLRNAPMMMKSMAVSKPTDEITAEPQLSDCRLPAIQSYCWGGFIFASLAGSSSNPTREYAGNDGEQSSAVRHCEIDSNAVARGAVTRDEFARGEAESNAEAGSTVCNNAPFDLTELQADIGAYHMEEMALFASFEEVWACNWKSLVENFMDGYHLSVVHPTTLRPLTPTNLCRKLSAGKHHTSFIANYTQTAPVRSNHHPDLSAELCRQSRLFCIYPSLVASVSADTLAFFMLQPQGLDRVSVKWGLASYEQNLSAEEKQARIDKWRAINEEDHAILQRLQAGLRSSYYQGGALAPESFEGCVGDFHRALVAALLK